MEQRYQITRNHCLKDNENQLDANVGRLVLIVCLFLRCCQLHLWRNVNCVRMFWVHISTPGV
jgi:hypothetical protein